MTRRSFPRAIPAAIAHGLLAALSVAAGTVPARAAERSVVIAFQPQEDAAKLAPNADRLAAFVAERAGKPVRAYLPTDYVAVVEALRAGHADVAYFSAWPYLLSKNLADTEILAAERRAGQTHYWSHWYVRADSKASRLADLKGTRVAFTAPTSTSGYLYPLAALIEDAVLAKGQDPKAAFAEVLFAGGYEQALKALVAGQVDAAAASDYAPERFLTEAERKSIRVLRRQGPVPTHLVACRRALDPALKKELRAAFLALSEVKHREVLRAAYGASELVAADETHVASLSQALAETGAGAQLARFKK